MSCVAVSSLCMMLPYLSTSGSAPLLALSLHTPLSHWLSPSPASPSTDCRAGEGLGAGARAGAWLGACLGAGRCSRMVSTAVTARWCGSEEGR